MTDPIHPASGDLERKLLVKLLDTLVPLAAVAAKFQGCPVVEISKPHPDNPSSTILPMPREWFERAADDLEAAAILLHARGVLSEGQASKITGLDRVSVRKQVDDFALRPANPPATAAGVGEAVAFGEGRLVVDTGTYHDKPAVFIAPVPVAGEVGSSAKHLGHDKNSLQPGETVLTFPTPDRAKAVAVALVGAPANPPATAAECPACYRGEIFGLSSQEGSWFEFSSVSGGASKYGIHGSLWLIEHDEHDNQTEHQYVRTDRQPATAAKVGEAVVLYIPMPVTKDGFGPADESDTHRIEHQIWDAETNGTLATAADEAVARHIVSLWNTTPASHDALIARVRSVTEAMTDAAVNALVAQYERHPEWDDAKDVIENLDVARVLEAALLTDLDARDGG